MDPVTAVGLVATVTQLIAVTTKVIKYLSDVKDAPKDRGKLALEISSLLTLLTNLRFEAEEAEESKEADPWFNNICSLAYKTGPLDQCKTALEKLSRKLKSEPGLKKFGRALVWTLDKKEVYDLLVQIERLKSLINIALARDTFKLSLAIKDDVEKIQQDYANTQVKQENRAILDWLYPFDVFTTQNDMFGKRQEGTGQWLLDSKEFTKWKSEKGSVLWCPGIPGAGKTILTSTVIDHIRKSSTYHDIGLAFIYFNYKEQAGQTSVSIVASLLKQLAQDRYSICTDLKSMYDYHQKKKSKPSFDEVSKALAAAISCYPQVFIILDALDECSEEDGCRHRMLNELSRLSDDANILMTSRQNVKIERYFDRLQHLNTIADAEDLRQYLEARLLNSPSLARIVMSMANLREQVINTIVASAKGMFLLARFQMDSIANKRTRNAIQKALSDLPKGLDDTYDDIMGRITAQNEDDRKIAMQALLWITFAERPLTVAELQEALAITPEASCVDEGDIIDEDIILSACAGIVTVDQESRIIRLVHYTTQEYFERIRNELFPTAQNIIAQACLTYLSFDAFSSGCSLYAGTSNRMKENVLYIYAVENWAKHACKKSDDCDDELALKFLINDAKVDSTAQILFRAHPLFPGNPSRFPEQRFSGVHLAAYFGLYKILKKLLANKMPADAKDGFSRTPLSWAAEKGHEAAVNVLLEVEYNVDIDSKDWDGMTPLHWAVIEGHEAMIKNLLARYEIDVDSQDDIYETPLGSAVYRKREAVVKLLLESNADPNITDIQEETPLFKAARNEQDFVLKLLLEANADPNITNYLGEIPLFETARNGHDSALKLLLEFNADPNITTIHNETPLFEAARNGHDSVLKLLLESNVDPNITNIDGETPLIEAAKNGHDSVLKLLLAVNADPNIKNHVGQTPLGEAVRNGHDSILKLLLEANADPNIKNRAGETPLFEAARKGHESIVKALLEQPNIDRNVQNYRNETPLLFVARIRTEAKTAVLLNSNYSSKDLHDNYGDNLLLQEKSLTLVKLMLEKDADINHRGHSSMTALSWAMLNKDEALEQLLLEHGADPNQGENGCQEYRQRDLLNPMTRIYM